MEITSIKVKRKDILNLYHKELKGCSGIVLVKKERKNH